MRLTLPIIFLALFLSVSLHAAENAPGGTPAAAAAGEAWLSHVDAARFDKSWDQAAGLFQSAVEKGQWAKLMRGTRTPLGKIVRRKLKSAVPTRSLPGAPDRDYVVLTFESEFTKKAAAVETVVSVLEDGGVWKVAGYYIK